MGTGDNLKEKCPRLFSIEIKMVMAFKSYFHSPHNLNQYSPTATLFGKILSKCIFPLAISPTFCKCTFKPD